MKAHKTLFRTSFILILLSCFLFFGCKKEVDPESQELASDGATLRTLFEQKGYDSYLLDKFSDTSRIRWTPSWMDGSIVISNDTTKFVHIVLTPQLESVVTNKVIPNVHFWGYTKRVIVKLSSTYTFYLGTYHSPQIEQSLSIPQDFTGTLMMKDLESNKNYLYRYLNGTLVK